MDDFQSEFRVGEKLLGAKHPVLIIAEAGVAHFGDIELARDLVDLAADAGADIFKTQFFDVEQLVAKRASHWQERLRPRNLSLDDAHELKDRCEKRGLIFMSTAHDQSRISWLRKLEVPAVKVGSGERNNPRFVTELAEIGKPMIISTGMSYYSDVLETLDACAAGGCNQVALLHCVTSYPAPLNQINLAAMQTLDRMFSGPVGYSDHTDGNLAVLAAVARGAKVVEKHITILRHVPNAQDWKVSAGPEDMAQLVTDIRRTENMIGSGEKIPAPCEKDGIGWALKSLVAIRDLPAGHFIAKEDLTAKRPGDGLLPNQISQVVGCRLKRQIAADELILLEDLI